MQVILNFPLQHQRKAHARLRNPLPTLATQENRLNSPGGRVAESVFQLVVRCARSQEGVGRLVLEALAEHLLSLRQRFTI
ncbi:MAG: hypothetical protein ABSC32_06625, partial [Steroidobacteraceae bacterium]